MLRSYIRDMSNYLGLCNIQAIHSRVEDLSSTYDGKYDYILGRAVAPMHKFIQWCVGYNLYHLYYFQAKKPNFVFERDISRGWGECERLDLLSSKDSDDECVLTTQEFKYMQDKKVFTRGKQQHLQQQKIQVQREQQ